MLEAKKRSRHHFIKTAPVKSSICQRLDARWPLQQPARSPAEEWPPTPASAGPLQRLRGRQRRPLAPECWECASSAATGVCWPGNVNDQHMIWDHLHWGQHWINVGIILGSCWVHVGIIYTGVRIGIMLGSFWDIILSSRASRNRIQRSTDGGWPMATRLVGEPQLALHADACAFSGEPPAIAELRCAAANPFANAFATSVAVHGHGCDIAYGSAAMLAHRPFHPA